MNRILIIILSPLLFFGCIGCSVLSDNIYKKNTEKLINQNLKPGDPEEKIIKFMKSQGWNYSYDDFSNCFQISDPKNKIKKIFISDTFREINIYVDKSKSFVKGEVQIIVTSF